MIGPIYIRVGRVLTASDSSKVLLLETYPPTNGGKDNMPDDKKKPGGQDRKRINVNEDYEAREWSKKFGVSQDELKKAVAKVGSSAEAVKKHLGR